MYMRLLWSVFISVILVGNAWRDSGHIEAGHHFSVITTNYNVRTLSWSRRTRNDSSSVLATVFKPCDPDARLTANSPQLFSWATMLELELIHDQRWKRQRLICEELLFSRDPLFHFLHVKSQLELSWFIQLQISSAAVMWLIRNSRFCPCHCSGLMILLDIFNTIPYYFSNKSISCSSSEGLHCFLKQQWFGKYWCLLTDLWPPIILIRRKSEVMLSHGLFSLLTERLMLHSSHFTMTTYNVLFEVSPLHMHTHSSPELTGLKWASYTSYIQARFQDSWDAV